MSSESSLDISFNLANKGDIVVEVVVFLFPLDLEAVANIVAPWLRPYPLEVLFLDS